MSSNGSSNTQGGNQTNVDCMGNVAQWLNGVTPVDPLGELGGIRPMRGATNGGYSQCCSQCHYVNVVVATPCCTGGGNDSKSAPANISNISNANSSNSNWPAITGAYTSTPGSSFSGAPSTPGPMNSTVIGGQCSAPPASQTQYSSSGSHTASSNSCPPFSPDGTPVSPGTYARIMASDESTPNPFLLLNSVSSPANSSVMSGLRDPYDPNNPTAPGIPSGAACVPPVNPVVCSGANNQTFASGQSSSSSGSPNCTNQTPPRNPNNTSTSIPYTPGNPACGSFAPSSGYSESGQLGPRGSLNQTPPNFQNNISAPGPCTRPLNPVVCPGPNDRIVAYDQSSSYAGSQNSTNQSVPLGTSANGADSTCAPIPHVPGMPPYNLPAHNGRYAPSGMSGIVSVLPGPGESLGDYRDPNNMSVSICGPPAYTGGVIRGEYAPTLNSSQLSGGPLYSTTIGNISIPPPPPNTSDDMSSYSSPPDSSVSSAGSPPPRQKFPDSMSSYSSPPDSSVSSAGSPPPPPPNTSDDMSSYSSPPDSSDSSAGGPPPRQPFPSDMSSYSSPSDSSDSSAGGPPPPPQNPPKSANDSTILPEPPVYGHYLTGGIDRSLNTSNMSKGPLTSTFIEDELSKTSGQSPPSPGGGNTKGSTEIFEGSSVYSSNPASSQQGSTQPGCSSSSYQSSSHQGSVYTQPSQNSTNPSALGGTCCQSPQAQAFLSPISHEPAYGVPMASGYAPSPNAVNPPESPRGPYYSSFNNVVYQNPGAANVAGCGGTFNMPNQGGGTYNMPNQAGGTYNMPNQLGGTYNMPNPLGGTYNMPNQGGGGGTYNMPNQGGGGGTCNVPNQGGGTFNMPNQGGAGGTYNMPNQGGAGGTYNMPNQGGAGGTFNMPNQSGGGGTCNVPNQGGGTFNMPNQGGGGTFNMSNQVGSPARCNPQPQERPPTPYPNASGSSPSNPGSSGSSPYPASGSTFNTTSSSSSSSSSKSPGFVLKFVVRTPESSRSAISANSNNLTNSSYYWPREPNSTNVNDLTNSSYYWPRDPNSTNPNDLTNSSYYWPRDPNNASLALSPGAPGNGQPNGSGHGPNCSCGSPNGSNRQ